MRAVRAKQEAAMTRRSPRRGADAGFAVVQTLVVIAIAGLVAALAIPAYAARAKESVLRQNTATLELEVKSYLAAGLDDSDDAANASAVIAHALGGPRGGISPWYVNPLCGSRSVVSQTALPAGAGGVPPAVWITDDQGYAFGAFTASPTTKSRLRGTLMIVSIVHDGRTSGIEVFYVDAAGHRSPTATTIAI
jgi:F0F1-type ATP synthase membrane subunit c/vacuolar-type H+-ATPase subunit K